MYYRIASRLAVVAAACGPLYGTSACADWSYDFASPPPSTFDIGLTGAPSETYRTSFANGMLRLSDSRTPAEGGVGGGVGVIGIERSQKFDDVRISATLNPAGDSDELMNLIRGWADVGIYGAGFDFSSGRLTVAKLRPWANVSYYVASDDPDQGNQPLLTDLNRSYFLEFVIMGDELDARLYDHEGGTELLVVQWTDDGSVVGPQFEPSWAGFSTFLGDGTTTNLDATFDSLTAVAIPSTPLQAGDADLDLDFDQLDLVKVQAAGRYLTGHPATWGEGDWNGAPGGRKFRPPAGDGRFDQLDIIAAQQAGVYLAGAYSAISRNGVADDARPSVAINDPTVAGTPAGGGEFGDVDLIYVPEPSAVFLSLLGVAGLFAAIRPYGRIRKTNS